MTKASLITTTAIVAGLMMSPALAIDVGAGADAAGSAGVSSGGVSVGTGVEAGASASGSADSGHSGTVDGNTTASVSSAANAALLITSLNDASGIAADIQTMTSVEQVSVIEIDDLYETAGSASLDTAISENAAAASELKAAISANADLMAEIDAQSIDATSIVAADVAADGSVTLFVK